MSDRSIKSIGAKPSQAFNLDRLQTPIGTALLVTDAGGVLRALDWQDYELRMQAAAASASTMLPSRHCSADKDFVARLRIIGSTEYSAIPGRAASLGEPYHQRRQRGPPMGCTLAAFPHPNDILRYLGRSSP